MDKYTKKALAWSEKASSKETVAKLTNPKSKGVQTGAKAGFGMGLGMTFVGGVELFASKNIQGLSLMIIGICAIFSAKQTIKMK